MSDKDIEHPMLGVEQDTFFELMRGKRLFGRLAITQRVESRYIWLSQSDYIEHGKLRVSMQISYRSSRRSDRAFITALFSDYETHALSELLELLPGFRILTTAKLDEELTDENHGFREVALWWNARCDEREAYEQSEEYRENTERLKRVSKTV